MLKSERVLGGDPQMCDAHKACLLSHCLRSRYASKRSIDNGTVTACRQFGGL